MCNRGHSQGIAYMGCELRSAYKDITHKLKDPEQMGTNRYNGNRGIIKGLGIEIDDQYLFMHIHWQYSQSRHQINSVTPVYAPNKGCLHGRTFTWVLSIIYQVICIGR